VRAQRFSRPSPTSCSRTTNSTSGGRRAGSSVRGYAADPSVGDVAELPYSVSPGVRFRNSSKSFVCRFSRGSL
jgi:hypothetical protein